MLLIECIIGATKKNIPFSNCVTKPVRISGWNIDMSIAHEQSLFWHGLWILCGKPETRQVASIMRFTRNNYHYKIRKMKNESRSRAKQSLATALVNNRTRDYWSKIKNKSKIEPISIVNGEYAHKDMANLFSCQYKWMCTYQILSSTIIPIPKNQRLNRKNSENCRAIALSSLFGNIFDKIVIEKQIEQLGTSELQFGYKTKNSTVMCSTALTKTIECYVS